MSILYDDGSGVHHYFIPPRTANANFPILIKPNGCIVSPVSGNVCVYTCIISSSYPQMNPGTADAVDNFANCAMFRNTSLSTHRCNFFPYTKNTTKVQGPHYSEIESYFSTVNGTAGKKKTSTQAYSTGVPWYIKFTGISSIIALGYNYLDFEFAVVRNASNTTYNLRSYPVYFSGNATSCMSNTSYLSTGYWGTSSNYGQNLALDSRSIVFRTAGAVNPVRFALSDYTSTNVLCVSAPGLNVASLNTTTYMYAYYIGISVSAT